MPIKGWDNMEKFVETCVRRFGSMNKNDYEIELFHLMMQQSELKNYSDFQISLCLQIPESKVKRLRYECDLRYPRYADDVAYKNELATLIVNRQFRVQNERIQFAISDKMLKLYINNLLMSDGRFLDTSFNNNIISITPDDLLFILEQLDAKSKDSIQKIRNSIKSGEKDLPKKMSEAIKDLLVKTSKSVIKKFTTEELSDALSTFCDAMIDKIQEIYNK